MKLAVLLYGRINNYDIHYKNTIEALGEENQVDFFLSTDPSLNEDILGFTKLYNPVLVCSDPINIEIDLYKYNNTRSEVNIHKMERHFFNKMRVFKLLEDYLETNDKNIEYDYIISTRVDMYFFEKVNYNLFTKDKKKHLFIPFNTYAMDTNGDFEPSFLNDQFAIGDFESMKIYMNIYNNLPLLLDNGYTVHPEILTKANVNCFEISVSRFYINYDLHR